MVEHTTTAAKGKSADGNLSTKWKRDLSKAIAQANQLKLEYPQALFTVILTSSHRPTETLLRAVYKAAEAGGVSLDIWEQSRIARKLDSTPEGHYLRHSFLGVAAEMLSPELLREICEQSLQEYERFVGFVGEQIAREEEAELRAALSAGLGLHFVVGDSGLGKSTLLWRAARETLAKGGYALWLPARHIGEKQSLQATIRHRLRDFCPTLLEASLDGLLSQFISSQSPLLLVADDPNRESSPSQIVSHLLAWMRPTSPEGEATSKTSRPDVACRVVCPLWPGLWAGHATEASSWCGTTFLQTFVLSDAVKLVTQCAKSVGCHLVERNAEEIAALLSCDPFLIGLWSELLLVEDENIDYAAAQELAANALENYVADKCHKAALLSSLYPAADFREALNRFAALLLEKREFAPTWLQYQEWLRDARREQDARILSELARHSSLWRLPSEGRENRPSFRHDRLRQFFLIEAMENYLQQVTSLPDAETLELCGDPFLAEIIGEAICRSTPSDSQTWLWRHLFESNPLALAFAYRGFVLRRSLPLNGQERKCRDFLHTQLAQWANQAQTKLELEEIVAAIGQAFHNVDDVELASILAPLGSHWDIGLALLRNGILSKGALRCMLWHWERADPRREPTIVRARMHHRAALIEQVSQKLVGDFRDEQGANDWQGAIVMAACLRFGEFVEPLGQAWQKVPVKQQKEFLPLFIWAALHCFQSDFEEAARQFLNHVFDVWAALSDEYQEELGGLSERSGVSHTLHHVIFNAWPEPALEFLTQTAQSRPDLSDSIQIALLRVDSPTVLTFFVHQENQSQEKGLSTMFPHVTYYWSEHLGRNRRYLSHESLLCARELWQDTTLSDRARRLAFLYWKTHPDGDDSALLAEIAASEPFYTDALQTRIQRGDLSVVPELLPMLEKDTLFWREAARIWCPAIKEATKTLAASFETSEEVTDDIPNGTYNLLLVLRDAPQEDAEEILLEYWPQLRKIVYFLPLALWIGTPRCVEVARQEIDQLSHSIRVFGHLSPSLFIWPDEGEEEKTRPQVLRFLRNVLPYWDRVDGPRRKSNHLLPSKPRPASSSKATPNPTPEELAEIMDTMESHYLIEAALRVRAFNWAREYLYPLITDEQKQQFFPSDDDLADLLDKILEGERNFDLSHHAHGAIYSFFSLNERNGIAIERLLLVFLNWLQKEPVLKRFQLAIAAVSEHGSRLDFENLQHIFSQADLGDDEKNTLHPRLANARFKVWRKSLK